MSVHNIGAHKMTIFAAVKVWQHILKKLFQMPAYSRLTRSNSEHVLFTKTRRVLQPYLRHADMHYLFMDSRRWDGEL